MQHKVMLESEPQKEKSSYPRHLLFRSITLLLNIKEQLMSQKTTAHRQRKKIAGIVLCVQKQSNLMHTIAQTLNILQVVVSGRIWFSEMLKVCTLLRGESETMRYDCDGCQCNVILGLPFKNHEWGLQFSYVFNE